MVVGNALNYYEHSIRHLKGGLTDLQCDYTITVESYSYFSRSDV